MDFTILNKTVLLIGKRASGKSELLRYLVNLSKTQFKTVFLVCPTEKVNNFYDGLIKPENIFDEYNEMWVEKLMKKMGEVNQNKSNHEASHILLILDDICSDLNLGKSKTIKQLFCRGRHLKISIIMTAQYIYQIPPVLRCNTDFVAVGQMNSQSLDLLTSEFQFGNITKKDFKAMYMKSTSNFNFLLINCNTAKDNDNLELIYGKISVDANSLRFNTV